MTMSEAGERIRAALIEAAVAAYENSGVSGLCLEGRWEAAIGAMRSLDLEAVAAASAVGKGDRPDSTGDDRDETRERSARIPNEGDAEER